MKITYEFDKMCVCFSCSVFRYGWRLNQSFPPVIVCVFMAIVKSTSLPSLLGHYIAIDLFTKRSFQFI